MVTLFYLILFSCRDSFKIRSLIQMKISKILLCVLFFLAGISSALDATTIQTALSGTPKTIITPLTTTEAANAKFVPINGKQSFVINNETLHLFDSTESSFSLVTKNFPLHKLLSHPSFSVGYDDAVVLISPSNGTMYFVKLDGSYETVKGLPTCSGQAAITRSYDELFYSCYDLTNSVLTSYKTHYKLSHDDNDAPKDATFSLFSSFSYHATDLIGISRSDAYLVVYGKNVNVMGIRPDNGDVKAINCIPAMTSENYILFGKSAAFFLTDPYLTSIISTTMAQDNWEISTAPLQNTLSVASMLPHKNSKVATDGLICTINSGNNNVAINCFSGIPYYSQSYIASDFGQLTVAELSIGIVLGSVALITMTIIFAMNDLGYGCFGKNKRS